MSEQLQTILEPRPGQTSRTGPAGLLQRACACGNHSGGGECASCREKREGSLQRAAVSSGPATAPPIVREVLRSPGQPLDPATRAFMKPRFGHDFSRVRVHTDSQAAESAQAVNALAYTVGSDIVFGAGHYAPQTSAGRRLMAHELTHVVQQQGVGSSLQTSLAVGDPGDAAEREAERTAAVVCEGRNMPDAFAPSPPSLQRACGVAAIGSPSGCVPSVPIFVTGAPFFRFDTGCDDFSPGEEAAMVSLVGKLPPTATIEIHGFASMKGPSAFNHNLACARALKAQSVLTAGTIAPSRITAILNHGPTPGPDDERQSVVIHPTVLVAPEVQPKCGPDATDWFIRQVNTAATDPAVLAIKYTLAAADILARSRGTTADDIAEGGATTAVEAQETLLGITGPPPPARKGAIVGQLALGAAARARAAADIAAAVAADPLGAPGDVATIIALIKRAALAWKALVDHRARYDFKAHTDSMRFPKGTNCPDKGCPPGEVGIITLCPGANAENCYESDMPGNIFYGLIGRHIGWSELTLQLGSQLAELTDVTPRPARPTVTWDTPDDTEAIHLGFRLGRKLPLTRADLCGRVAPARGALAARNGCDDCLDPTPSLIR